MLEITSLYTALLTFIFFWLSLRVIVYRRGNKVSMGHNGDNSLLKRMRAQGNFIEYVPFGLILLALVEFSGAPGAGGAFTGADVADWARVTCMGLFCLTVCDERTCLWDDPNPIDDLAQRARAFVTQSILREILLRLKKVT